jgi:hypothetical protein
MIENYFATCIGDVTVRSTQTLTNFSQGGVRWLSGGIEGNHNSAKRAFGARGIEKQRDDAYQKAYQRVA